VCGHALHVLRAAHFNVFKPQMMLRTIKAKSADDTSGVNFRIRGLGSDGVLGTDWAFIDPFGD